MVGAMQDPTAELASIADALEQLTRRIGGLADDFSGGPRDSLAHDLFEVERTLTSAQRRLSRITK